MKDALLYIVSSIITSSKKPEIEESVDEGVINFTVSVDKENIGKVIGKEGKVIKAIRTVLRIAAIKQNKRVNINLVEATS